MFSFQNYPKKLDPSYKMDLHFWDCFERKKFCLITEENGIAKFHSTDLVFCSHSREGINPSENQINAVNPYKDVYVHCIFSAIF